MANRIKKDNKNVNKTKALDFGFMFKNEGAWVDWECGIKLKIKFLDYGRTQEILDENTNEWWDAEAKQYKQESDMATVCKQVVIEAVTDWEGIVENGLPVPFTKENKERYAKRDLSLASFVQRIVSNKEEFLKVLVEDETKKP